VKLPPLHDVRDPEALCHSVLKSVIGSNGGHFSAADREDVMQYLRTVIWRLSERYKPGRSRISFSTYASYILRRRMVDWYRKQLVDTRYSTRAPDLSLDELLERLDDSVHLEENDDVPDREQNDLLTRLAIAMSAADDVSPIEAAQNWFSYLTPLEEATA